MKKIFRFIASLLVLALFAGWLLVTYFPQKLVPGMLNWQVNRQVELIKHRQKLLDDKESITVFTVGTSSPMPGNRVQSGTAVIVNGHFFMFDVGDGVVQKAENIGLPLDQLDGIFITHWHSDHMIDLPGLISRSWILGRTDDLHLFGPDGTDTLNQAINQYLHIENQHRVDHHGHEIMDISKASAISHEFKNNHGEKTVVFQKDGITVTAFDVSHEPVEPAVGYAIEYKGKKVVISGDTKKNDLVLEMATNADLLLHEVILSSLLKQMIPYLEGAGLHRNAVIVTDIQDYHTTPAEVAELAVKANVKRLVLHHFVPAPDSKVIKNLYENEMAAYEGPIHLANDGDMFIVR